MFEELFEALIGPWGIAAVLVLGTQRGRQLARSAFKETVKLSMVATERVKEAYAEIQEEAQDAIAEAHAERQDNSKHLKVKHAHANPNKD
jgi:ArsR family metal-binding transcriptional regulator